MPTTTVKNIPDDLYQRLKESAEANRRSLNSEILVCLERAVAPRPSDPRELLDRVRAVRQRAAAHPDEPPLSDEQVTLAKREGRA